MGRHEMRRPEPRRQRQLGPMHHRSRRDRSLSTAIEALVCVGATLQRRRALLATAGTNKTLRPTPFHQKRRRNSPRRETSLEAAKTTGPWPLRAPSRPPRTATQLSPHTTSRATWDSGISLRKLPNRTVHQGLKTGAFQDRRFSFEEIGKRNDVMNDTVATKVQDTPTSATSSELAVVIGTRTVEYHQGQRSYTAPTGRTYDRSRPKRSERQKPLAKRPSTYGGCGGSGSAGRGGGNGG